MKLIEFWSDISDHTSSTVKSHWTILSGGYSPHTTPAAAIVIYLERVFCARIASGFVTLLDVTREVSAKVLMRTVIASVTAEEFLYI